MSDPKQSKVNKLTSTNELAPKLPIMASELSKDTKIEDLLDLLVAEQNFENLDEERELFRKQRCIRISHLVLPPNDTEAGLRASLEKWRIPDIIANLIVIKMKEMDC